jgi:hypothetical protein
VKRLLLIAAFALIGALAGRALYLAAASDETRIAWLLEAEVDAFNSMSILSTLDHFAADYRDETRGIDLPGLRAAVLWLFRSERGPAGSFLCRVELPEEDLRVGVDGDEARAEFRLRLHEGDGPTEELRWEGQVVVELRRTDVGWRIARSRHETLSGRLPGH